MPIPNAKAKLLKVDQLTENVFELTFEMIEPAEMNFKAGQYITIKINESTRRQYSLSNSPLKSKKIFTLTIDKRPNGVGVNYLLSLKPNDVISFIGEIGIFTLPYTLTKNLYFFSTGVGIAPLKSMVETLILSGKYKDHNIYVVWGTRYKNWIIYENLFSEYSNKNYIKEYVVFLTKEETKKHRLGRLTRYIQENTFTSDSQFFVCGSTKSITGIRDSLLNGGVDNSQIFYEKFY